ncbi:MAG: acyl carrier protein phosphodiesterase [Bacteroidota bacterium]
MNFLAHLFLSCESEELVIGNMIADFIRNKDLGDYSPDIQKGVFLHRQIDSFTDQHPVVLQGVHRLQKRHRKYAPVVIDILYDYVLSQNWDRYSGRSLEEFTQWIYQILEKHLSVLPEPLRHRIKGMIQGNWLMGYGTKNGLLYTLERMDERTRFPSNFVGAWEDLHLHYEDFDREFNAFFPDVVAFVQEQCRC